MRSRNSVLLAGFLALAGCGGSESPNPLNGSTLTEANRNRTNAGAKPQDLRPIPVLLRFDASATSSSANLTLKKLTLSRNSEADTIFNGPALNLWPGGFLMEAKSDGGKLIYLGTAPRSQGYVRATLEIEPNYSFLPLGEAAPKTSKWAQTSLGTNLDPNLAFGDAIVLQVSLDETKAEAQMALGKADGFSNPRQQIPRLFEGKFVKSESKDGISTVQAMLAGKATTLAIETDRVLGTFTKAGTPITVGAIMDFASGKLVPSFVAASQKELSASYSLSAGVVTGTSVGPKEGEPGWSVLTGKTAVAKTFAQPLPKVAEAPAPPKVADK